MAEWRLPKPQVAGSTPVSRSTFALTGLAVAMIASCAQEDGRAEAPRETELVVFAASSLRDVFTEMAASFERAHGGAHVTFNFAGTQELRTQLEHGAPVDVFASADTRHMEELVEARRVGAARVFARNEPVVAVSREATRKIRAFGDLPIAARIVLGAPDVPIGRYSQQILDRAEPGFRARVEAKVASRELNVRQVLAKVALGEADAGIVYRTDVPAGDERVSVVAIPPEVNVIAAYPIAVVANAAHPGLARAWMDLVMSEDSQRALADGGFLPPVR